MPTAFRNGSIPLPVLGPSLAGLALWFGGPGSELAGDHDTGVSWTNTANTANNGNLFALPGNGPYVGVGAPIAGKPVATWRVDVDHTQRLEIDGGGGLAQAMKTTTGGFFTSTAIAQTPRTFILVHRPILAAGVLGGLVGGTACSWCDDVPFEPLFELSSDLVLNQFGVFSTRLDWGRGTAHYIAGPATPAATYNGVALITQWANAGGTNVLVRVNGGAPLALAPAILDLTPTTAGQEWVLGDRAQPGAGNIIFRYKGDMAEGLAWNVDLEADPAALTRTYQYLQNVYAPTIPVVVP